MLDACAGLGGKSISFINEDPTLDITALEPNQKRFNGLNENIKRLNLKQIEAKNIDLQTFSLQNKDGNKFDFILLDVPCSGLGIIRHKPYNILTIPTLEEGVISCQNLKSSKFIRRGFNPLLV